MKTRLVVALASLAIATGAAEAVPAAPVAAGMGSAIASPAGGQVELNGDLKLAGGGYWHRGHHDWRRDSPRPDPQWGYSRYHRPRTRIVEYLCHAEVVQRTDQGSYAIVFNYEACKDGRRY